MIRDNLIIILGEELRFLDIKTKERLSLTQREMGEKLQMSESSYSDIETGKYNCGALTAILLLGLQEDPERFLLTVNENFDSWLEKQMLTV